MGHFEGHKALMCHLIGPQPQEVSWTVDLHFMGEETDAQRGKLSALGVNVQTSSLEAKRRAW